MVFGPQEIRGSVGQRRGLTMAVKDIEAIEDHDGPNDGNLFLAGDCCSNSNAAMVARRRLVLARALALALAAESIAETSKWLVGFGRGGSGGGRTPRRRLAVCAAAA